MRIRDWSSDVCSSYLSAHGRPTRGQRLQADAQGDDLPDRGRAIEGLASVGPGWKRVRRRAQWLRHEPVRLAAWLRTRCGTRAARVGLRDRSAASAGRRRRSDEHTSELQSLLRLSFAVFCSKKTNHLSLNL